jgi:hypothetical protein
VCSNQAGGGTTESVCVFNDDDFNIDDSTDFFVEVDGFGNAVNDYTLTVAGNVTVANPASCANGA